MEQMPKIEKKEGFEIGKLSAPAAGLLVALGAVQATEVEAQQRGAISQAFEQIEKNVAQDQQNPAAPYVGAFLKELRRQNFPQNADEAAIKGMQAGANELGSIMQKLNQVLSAETQKRGIK